MDLYSARQWGWQSVVNNIWEIGNFIMRTHYCGHLNKSLAGQTVELCGWVNRRRDLGGLIFIDMRDREGIVQVVVDPDMADAYEVANTLRNEFCIKLTGEVRVRPESQVNKDMACLLYTSDAADDQ